MTQKQFTIDLISKFLNDLANYKTNICSVCTAAYHLRAVLSEVEKIQEES